MITEDFVNESVASYLQDAGYEIVSQSLGTRKGPDIEARDSANTLVVECKGETRVKDQWRVAWENCARAFFNLLKAIEKRETNAIYGLAFPDTDNYRRRMKNLDSFCSRHFIPVFWVTSNGVVTEWKS